jgi:hypothetical protein
MSTINRLSSVDVLQPSDQIPVWDSSNGDTRKASMSTLLAFVESYFADPDYSTRIVAPNVDGFNVDIGNTGDSSWLIVNPTLNYTTGSITLPTTAYAVNDQEITVVFTAQVSSFSITGAGATVLGAPTQIGTYDSFRVRYNAAQLTWYTLDTTGDGSGSGTSSIVRQQFTGDGTTTTFTLANAPAALGNELQVFIDGVYQERAGYSVSGNDLVFSEAPPVLSTIEVLAWGINDIGATTANLVTYTPAGTGAVATTVQDKLRESVSVLDFGAVANSSSSESITANNLALQAAINASSVVFFPAGSFYFDATITCAMPNPHWFGAGEFATELNYTGAGSAFEFDGDTMLTAGGAYVTLNDFSLNGAVPALPRLYFVDNTYAFKDVSTASPYQKCNFQASRINVRRFKYMFTGTGGFYWKFVDCQFLYCYNAFVNVTANNLAFFGCRFGVGEVFVSALTGYGPISFFGCSLEAFGQYCVTLASGKTKVNMTGCYFENDPTILNVGAELSGFGSGIVIGGNFDAISFIGNSLQCKGIRRVIYSTSTNQITVTSTGNYYEVETGASSTTEYLYEMSSAATGSTLLVNDTAEGVASLGLGAYTTVGANLSSGTDMIGTDPVAGRTWIAITPSTGWSNTGTASYPTLSGRIINNVLYIRGLLTTTGASLRHLPAPQQVRRVFTNQLMTTLYP